MKNLIKYFMVATLLLLPSVSFAKTLINPGEPFLVQGSFCLEEKDATSVLDAYEEKDFNASVELFNVLTSLGKCGNATVVVIPQRKIYEKKDGVVLEVTLVMNDGETREVYLLSRTMDIMENNASK